MKVFGVVGWKNSGKTTLVAALVREIKSLGYTVSTVKHAHHAFDLDQPGRDSYKHREAGAKEVLISSGKRWALMHEVEDEDPYSLDELLGKMQPVDLVLIEGYKTARHMKIECHRENAETPLILENDETVIALAKDQGSKAVVKRDDITELDINDVSSIAEFILKQFDT